MTFLTAICDDRPDHAQNTAALAAEACPTPDQLRTECFYSPGALLDTIRSDSYRPQLAILDIDMPGMDGIALAGELRTLLPECRVIFISAYLDYVSEVYTAEHVWFLYKETAEKYMAAAIGKALESFSNDAGGTILVTTRKFSRPVAVKDILYLERCLHNTVVRTDEEEITVTRHPDELLKEIPPGTIVRCHQSYWVPFSAVRELKGSRFILRNNTQIPISRSRMAVREQYFDYLERLLSTHRFRD